MAKRTKAYTESLYESLQDPEEAAEYLNVSLAEVHESGIETFLLALRDVAAANGMSEVAEKAELGRQSLYKTLSEAGNPQVTTLLRLLDAIKLKFVIEPVRKSA